MLKHESANPCSHGMPVFLSEQKRRSSGEVVRHSELKAPKRKKDGTAGRVVDDGIGNALSEAAGVQRWHGLVEAISSSSCSAAAGHGCGRLLHFLPKEPTSLWTHLRPRAGQKLPPCQGVQEACSSAAPSSWIFQA